MSQIAQRFRKIPPYRLMRLLAFSSHALRPSGPSGSRRRPMLAGITHLIAAIAILGAVHFSADVPLAASGNAAGAYLSQMADMVILAAGI
jgi:hypothetical protein